MLRINQLTHCYINATSPVLTDINLSIKKGVCLGLLGPNGAGKTTLISILCGLQPQQTGEIRFNQIQLSKLSTAQSQKISLIPQDFAFYPNLTVWENIRFFASLYKVSKTSFLIECLDKVKLNLHHKTLAKNLSGGLKRRLNFAIGLVNTPDLIFMDEVTVGVDPESRLLILNNITQLTEQGTTVIYTSHYLHEIEKICQQIVILDQGLIKYDGEIAAILQSNVKPKLFITTQNVIPQSDLVPINAEYTDNSHCVVLHALNQPISDVLKYLELNHHVVTNINYGHGSLEAFYLTLLREAHNNTSLTHQDRHIKNDYS